VSDTDLIAAGAALANAAASIEQAISILGTAAVAAPGSAPAATPPTAQPAAKPTIGDQVLSWLQANLLKK
jgi:hypothetical protein